MPRGSTKPLLGTLLQKGHALAPDRAFYLFNEGAGHAVEDLTRNNFVPASLTGAGATFASWAQGKYGSAVTTNGTDQFVDFGTNASTFVAGGSFTYALRVMVTGGAGTTRYIFSDYNAAGSASSFSFRVNTSNQFSWHWEYTAGIFHLCTNPTALTLNQWYSILCTCDGSTEYLYVDGIQVATAAVSGQGRPTNNTGKNFNLGRAGNLGAPYAPVTCDFIAIWSRYLPPSEARQFSLDPYQVLVPTGTLRETSFFKGTTLAVSKPTYAAAAGITITMTSLASTSARASSVVDNSSNLYLDALVAVTVKTSASALGTNPNLTIYAYALTDGGGYTDNVTGTDAAFTMISPTNLRILGIINTPSVSTSYFSSPFSVALAFGGVLPQKWGVVAVNNTGQAIDATTASASYIGVQITTI